MDLINGKFVLRVLFFTGTFLWLIALEVSLGCAQGENIRVDTNLVTIPVTVLDRDGRYIADLTDKDFEIYENGIKQKNEFFASTEEPITVMLLLDASSSITYGQTAGMAKAVNEFVNMLRPDDQLIAASFAYRVYPILDATKIKAVSYTHLRAHETVLDLVCRLLLEKKTKTKETDVLITLSVTKTHHEKT